ncbi:MAG: pseudouridine synthase [Anaerolineae bacterium]|nr:pseudouridine synthase [Anaerolineae bacterium]MDQ7035269.1 pseudouridine synthase [Anaerolineae bacterium]
MAQERVQKLMARANIASRRKSEEIIEAGRVTVNGKIISLGDKADPQTDTIVVDGERLKLKNIENRYYVFHKPSNVLSTNKAPDGDNRPTVRELLPIDGHLFSIGRLDAQSEGLMVLTNDGDITNKLSHPRYEHTKTYKVTVYGKPTAETLVKWENGIWLDGTRTAPCFIRVLEENPETTILRIIMIEGRRRQIRRVAAILDHPVKKLVRTHIGQLGLGTLRRGAWYRLDDDEVKAMLVPAEEVKFIRRKNKKFHGRTRFEEGDQ